MKVVMEEKIALSSYSVSEMRLSDFHQANPYSAIFIFILYYHLS